MSEIQPRTYATFVYVPHGFPRFAVIAVERIDVDEDIKYYDFPVNTERKEVANSLIPWNEIFPEDGSPYHVHSTSSPHPKALSGAHSGIRFYGTAPPGKGRMSNLKRKARDYGGILKFRYQ